MKYCKKLDRGFTLIELIVVIAIVGVLVAIAIPSYNSYVKKGRRADAQAGLMALAQAMERVRTDKGSYAWANGDTNDIAGATAPSIYPSQLPVDGTVKFYNLKVNAANIDSYEIEAIAINSQVGDGNLSLSSTGFKRWDRENNDYTDGTDDCWASSC